jgi:hypothetical protein
VDEKFRTRPVSQAVREVRLDINEGGVYFRRMISKSAHCAATLARHASGERVRLDKRFGFVVRHGALKRLQLLSVLVLAIQFCGCTIFRDGGAPQQSFDVKKDLEELATRYKESTTITEFYKNPSEEARNEFVTGRIVLMNIRYIQFIRGMTREKQVLDAATDILLLSLNLTGAGISGETAKTIFHSLAAGVSGSKIALDKNFYYEKSVPALVAAMNAERASILESITASIRKPLSQYPFNDAVTDVQRYFEAGTLMGAINAIQRDAGAKNAKATDNIALLKDLAQDDIDRKGAMTKAIGSLTDADLNNAQATLTELNAGAGNLAKIDDLKLALQREVRQRRAPDTIRSAYDIFKKHNLIK